MSGAKSSLVASLLVAMWMISCGQEAGVDTDPDGGLVEVGGGDDWGDGRCRVFATGDEIRIECPDGTKAVFGEGIAGAGGASDEACVVVDNEDDTHTVTCSGGDEIVVKSIQPVGGVVAESFTLSSPFQVMFLADVREIGGTVIFEVPTIRSLVLPSLRKVGGSVWIDKHTQLEALSLPELKSMDGSLLLSGNDSLTSLKGLRALTSVKTLRIADHVGLTSLAGLDSLVSTSDSLIIVGNDGLKDLMGLDGVKSVGGSVHIQHNKGLTSLAGLNELTYIGGSLEIYGNTSLCQSSVDNWVVLLLNKGEVGETRSAHSNKDCG